MELQSFNRATAANTRVQNDVHARFKDFLQIEDDLSETQLFYRDHMDSIGAASTQFRAKVLHTTILDFLEIPVIKRQLFD